MDIVKVGRSRFNTFLLIIAAIGFVVVGGWMLFVPESDVFLKIIGIVASLFFGAAIPLGIKKLITNGDGLHLNSTCLIIEPDSSQSLSIPWSEITGFGEVNIKGTKIILVHIKQPESKINKESNPIKRKMMQFNNSRYNTPYNITASGLSISHKKLSGLLHQFHSTQKN